jgi:hypothetical protein
MTAAPAGMWFPLPPHRGIVCSVGRRQGPSPRVHGVPSLRAIHLDPSRLRGKVFRHEVGGGRMREEHKRADNFIESCGGPDRYRI